MKSMETANFHAHYENCNQIMAPQSAPRRWYHWFHPDDSPQERKLIWKLDLLVVGYSFIVYWVSYENSGDYEANGRGAHC
jgi:hypothetical protein